MSLNWRAIIPQDAEVSQREIVLSALAALLGIGVVAFITLRLLDGPGVTLLLASVGAAAVLLYAAPSSQMAQPWPLVGGNLVSAAIGVTCSKFVPDIVWAGALAVSLSIFIMANLRCLHPPSGATALVAVVGGPQIKALGFSYVLAPVGLNIAILLLVAWVTNRWLLRRDYPSRTVFSKRTPDGSTPSQEWQQGHGLSPDDIKSALHELNTYVDVTTDDLSKIFSLALLHHQKRHIGDIQCRHIMATELVTAEFATELEEIWAAFRMKKSDGAPVIDRARRVIGIVTLNDFLRHVDHSRSESPLQRIAHLIRRTPGVNSDKPEVAGQIMTSPAITVRDTENIVNLIPIFTTQRIHHIPVTDASGKLVGMVTWADVMGALERALPNS